MRWYVSQNGETSGPVDDSVVSEWTRGGQLGRGAFVRDEHGGQWTQIESSPFASLLGPAPAEPSATAPAQKNQPSTVAAIGGVFVALIACGAIASAFDLGDDANKPKVARHLPTILPVFP